LKFDGNQPFLHKFLWALVAQDVGNSSTLAWM